MRPKEESVATKVQSGDLILSEKMDSVKTLRNEKDIKKEMKRLEKEKIEREKREKKAREKERERQKQAKKGNAALSNKILMTLTVSRIRFKNKDNVIFVVFTIFDIGRYVYRKRYLLSYTITSLTLKQFKLSPNFTLISHSLCLQCYDVPLMLCYGKETHWSFE